MEASVGAELAQDADLEVLDEPTHNDDGSLREPTRANGRPPKAKTTVAKAAAGKADKPADNG